MGLLDRYRKTGGFIQLLQLLETTGAQKRDQFLKMINEEDPRWFAAIEQKMLSIDRILSWDENVLGEIASRLHELTLAIALHGQLKGQEDRMFKTFSAGQRRKIQELSATKNPTPPELAAAYIKILEEVRGLIKQGFLRPEKFDANLIIEEKIEEKLDVGARPVSASQVVHDIRAESGSETEAVEMLSNQVAVLSSENRKLKSELRIAQDKLEQIRKIA
jgi:hypothetical protein